MERDFAPILLLAATPNVIIANRDSGIRDLATLAAEARRRGDLAYGSPGVGSQLHLTMEVLKRRLGLPLTHVPYRGTTQAGAGSAVWARSRCWQATCLSPCRFIRNGQVLAVAVTTAERTPLAPEIPTLAEQGVPDLDVASWYGLFAPRATPPEVQEAIRTPGRGSAACAAERRGAARAGHDRLGGGGRGLRRPHPAGDGAMG